MPRAEPPVEHYLSKIKPAGWRQIRDNPQPYSLAFLNSQRTLKVIISYADHSDGKRWVHLSVSARDLQDVLGNHSNPVGRVPTWDELVEVKEAFLGADSKAVMVLPPRSEWVNIHPFVHHMWMCVESENPLPDFTEGMGTL